MRERTPTPWRIDGEHLRTLVRGADGTIVALRHRLPAETHVANADFIVRACNSHDELVDALKEAHLQLVYLDDKFATGTTPAVLARIHAALVKASQP